MEQFGMDVHKDTITVAVTAAGEVGKAMPSGRFPNTTAALETIGLSGKRVGGRWGIHTSCL
jgi:hypothetical protein